ncbi:hypothetical protein MHU86_14130 [Fragilaria crotonensis]|nr:hypothetical protein MHU86_14130 [Fragilaria crotonensis]
MSRPSQKRKKFARKPTPRHATLETVREDEALVATATLSSTLHDPTAIASNMFRNTSKRGRQRKAKAKGAQTPRLAVLVPGTEASDALEAVWNAIDTFTKKTLTIQLRQLVDFVDQGREDLRSSELRTIQLNISPIVGAETVAVTSFMTILREGRIEAIREIKARAEDMWNTRDELMDEVD